MNNMRITSLAFVLIGLSACASTPEVDTTVQTSAPVTTGPVMEKPSPPPPVALPQTAPPVTVMVDPNAPVPGSAADFAYQSGGDPRIYFGYNRFDLNNDARSALRRQADWLNLYSTVTAIVEGNADERGTREYNLALGARRAESVKSFLISQGVSPARLTTVSYGKERPIDARSSEAGWSRNRNGYTNINTGTIG